MKPMPDILGWRRLKERNGAKMKADGQLRRA
jgi:hypothetical protein